MRGRSSRTSLFLMELILVILFFSISAAVCLRVFAAAKLTAERSRELSAAVRIAGSAAECWKASNGDLDACADLLRAEESGGVLIQKFDGDWNTTESNAAYQLRLAADSRMALVSVSKIDGGEIYALAARAAGGG